MRFSTSALVAFATTTALAAPSSTSQEEPRQASGACSAAVTLDATTNVFSKYTLHPNNFYRQEVTAAIANLSDQSLAAAAKVVADTGTFLWM